MKNLFLLIKLYLLLFFLSSGFSSNAQAYMCVTTKHVYNMYTYEYTKNKTTFSFAQQTDSSFIVTICYDDIIFSQLIPKERIVAKELTKKTFSLTYHFSDIYYKKLSIIMIINDNNSLDISNELVLYNVVGGILYYR